MRVARRVQGDGDLLLLAGGQADRPRRHRHPRGGHAGDREAEIVGVGALVQDHHRQAQALAWLDADLGGIQEQADRLASRAGAGENDAGQLERLAHGRTRVHLAGLVCQQQPEPGIADAQGFFRQPGFGDARQQALVG